MDATDKRMTAERCAKLSLIAIVNKLDEAWMGCFPIMLLIYGVVYFPNVAKACIKILGSRRIQSFRDSKVTVEVQQ